jgi:hypothetical protein
LTTGGERRQRGHGPVSWKESNFRESRGEISGISGRHELRGESRGGTHYARSVTEIESRGKESRGGTSVSGRNACLLRFLLRFCCLRPPAMSFVPRPQAHRITRILGANRRSPSAPDLVTFVSSRSTSNKLIILARYARPASVTCVSLRSRYRKVDILTKLISPASVTCVFLRLRDCRHFIPVKLTSPASVTRVFSEAQRLQAFHTSQIDERSVGNLGALKGKMLEC